MRTKAAALFLVLMASLAAIALSFSCTQPVQPTLEVTPAAATLIIGQTAQLTVTRRFPGGPVDVVTDRVMYSSSNRNAAVVDERGQVLAREEAGSVIIRIQDRTSDAVVTASFIIEPPRIQTIDVAPAAIVMQPGISRRFSATARLTNGVIKDVTSQVIWSSGNEAVATVGRTPADFGVVIAASDGDTTITAADPASTAVGQTQVFVRGSGASVKAVIIAPNPAEIPLGGKKAFTATALLGDGTTRDVTSVVTWTSSNQTLATIDATGAATGVAAGGVTITGIYAPSSEIGDAGADADSGASGVDAGDAGSAVTVVGIRGSAEATVR